MNDLKNNLEFGQGQGENTSPPELQGEPAPAASNTSAPGPGGRTEGGGTGDRKEPVASGGGSKSSGGKRNSKRVEEVEAIKGVEMELNTSNLKVSENRENCSYAGDRFDELQEMVKKGTTLERLIVYEDEETHEHFAPDGELRRRIYESLGRSVPVIVYTVKNAKRHAWVESLKANAKGIRLRTNAEKRKKADEALDDEELGKRSVSELTKLLQTSDTYIYNLKRERAIKQKANQGSVATSDEFSDQDESSVADENREAEEVKGDLVLSSLVEAVGIDKDDTFVALHGELKRIRADLEKLSLNENWVADAMAKKTLEAIGKAARKLSQRKGEVPEFDIARLKDFQRQHDLTLEELAKLLGTTHATVSRWINGKMKVSAPSQCTIEQTFLLDSAEIAEILERGGDA